MTPTLGYAAAMRLMTSMVLALLAATPAVGRNSDTGGNPLAPARPDHGHAIMPGYRSDVVRPPAGVDPGILRPTPALPRQSTPVIDPGHLAANRPSHHGKGALRKVPK